MDRESIEQWLKSIIEFSTNLIHTTVRQLLTGKEINSEDWSRLGSSSNALLEVFQDPNYVDIPHPGVLFHLRILKQLACVVTDHSLALAREDAKQIHSIEHSELEYKLGQAIVSMRASSSSGKDQAHV